MARGSRDPVMQSSPRTNSSERSFSPRKSAGAQSVGSWLGRKASAKAVPDPPVARDPGKEMKSGVATVRRADVYKPYTQGDPYIEVVCDGIVIGRTPPCSCYDRRPIFEHTMRMHDFEVDSTVHVVIMSKKSWPYKDIEVARGSLELTKDLFIRRAIEEDVDIFMPAKDGEHPMRYGDEHMAAVYLNIDFVMPISMTTFQKNSRRGDVLTGSGTTPLRSKLPDLSHESDRGIEDKTYRAASTSATSSSFLAPPSSRARPHAAEGEDNGRGEEESNGSVKYSTLNSARSHDRGAGVGPVGFPVALRQQYLVESRQYLVEHQYWGRHPMASSPVLCTPGVMILLRSLWNSLLCIKQPPEDDGLIDIDGDFLD